MIIDLREAAETIFASIDEESKPLNFLERAQAWFYNKYHDAQGRFAPAPWNGVGGGAKLGDFNEADLLKATGYKKLPKGLTAVGDPKIRKNGNAVHLYQNTDGAYLHIHTNPKGEVVGAYGAKGGKQFMHWEPDSQYGDKKPFPLNLPKVKPAHTPTFDQTELLQKTGYKKMPAGLKYSDTEIVPLQDGGTLLNHKFKNSSGDILSIQTKSDSGEIHMIHGLNLDTGKKFMTWSPTSPYGEKTNITLKGMTPKPESKSPDMRKNELDVPSMLDKAGYKKLPNGLEYKKTQSSDTHDVHMFETAGGKKVMEVSINKSTGKVESINGKDNEIGKPFITWNPKSAYGENAPFEASTIVKAKAAPTIIQPSGTTKLHGESGDTAPKGKFSQTSNPILTNQDQLSIMSNAYTNAGLSHTYGKPKLQSTEVGNVNILHTFHDTEAQHITKIVTNKKGEMVAVQVFDLQKPSVMIYDKQNLTKSTLKDHNLLMTSLTIGTKTSSTPNPSSPKSGGFQSPTLKPQVTYPLEMIDDKGVKYTNLKSHESMVYPKLDAEADAIPLTPKQIEGFSYYKSNNYYDLNDRLRTGKALTPTQAAHVKAMDEDFKHVIPEGEVQVLYRSWGSYKLPKEDFTDAAFVSTSHLGSFGAQAELHLMPGTKYNPIDGYGKKHGMPYSGESEVLLPKNTMFKYTGKTNAEGLPIYEVYTTH